ncbi:NRAMP family, partial [Ochromonadaceae sp. CCMP2298]
MSTGSRPQGYGSIPQDEVIENGTSDHESHGLAKSRVPNSASLQDVHRSVQVPSRHEPWWRKALAYAGPGALVAVGYMDPGNWATDIAGGSSYNYDLLFVVLWSSLLGLFYQLLAVKLAIASEMDLAQACRKHYPPALLTVLWAVAEVAIIATDLAEVLGSAIALQLLFGWRLEVGVLVTVADVAIVFLAQGSRIRVIEVFVLLLILVIVASFSLQLWLSQPALGPLLRGMLVPTLDTVTQPAKLFLAISILGATIMPHSLFLHSSMVLTRANSTCAAGKREALQYAAADCSLSLLCALFVNGAILVVAAATFYSNDYRDVADLYVAYKLLDPLLGDYSSAAFGVALLAAGLNSTLTGTMAGQIVMEGFLEWRIDPVYRRIATRALAIVPAMVVIVVGGEQASNSLLLFSQVVLSFAL